MGRGRAFTLIELMIAIALVAILFAVATSTYMQFGGLQRQIEYNHSLTQSASQLEMLREDDFETLPPELRPVGKGGNVELARSAILESSVVVWEAGSGRPIEDWTFDEKSSRLTLQGRPPGEKVIVDYQFFLGSQNMAEFADSQGRVKLPGGEGFRLERVYVAQGDRLAAVTNTRVEGEYLQLPATMSGKLIVLDYYDDEGRNKVSGRFLDRNLRETRNPTTTKLIEVQEPFVGGGKMSLPLLKEQKP